MPSKNPLELQHEASRNERYDGESMLSMFASALRLMEANVPEINRLNVFPVPDGDTGTNMFLTLRDVVIKSSPRAVESVADTSRDMAREALMGGRGNSGVLLSQFFAGMAEALEGCDELGGAELARSLSSASVYAYGGIAHPREGTILTVMRKASDAAQTADQNDITNVLNTACDAALDAVAKTPSQLAVLRRAGLVDSGGYGFYIMLEGMRRHHLQTGELDEIFTPPQPSQDGNISAEFLEEIEEEKYGFCTQFVIESVASKALDKSSIMARAMEMGDSVVVIGDSEIIRVHLHTDEPDEVIGYAGTLGEVSERNVQDMDTQREQYSAERRAEITDSGTPTVIAVVQGRGLEEVFQSSNIEHLVSGGDTMNPSVGDLLDAIENTPTQSVIILPNNPNIILAAQNAAGLSSKAVRVVPSKTVMEGIAATLEYTPMGDKALDELAEDMQEQIRHLQSGAIFPASKDSELVDGSKIEEGQLVAALDGKLVYASDTLEDALFGLLENAAEDAEIITMYWGEPLNKERAESLMKSAADMFSESEIEFQLYEGGQPHYHLFLSIE